MTTPLLLIPDDASYQNQNAQSPEQYAHNQAIWALEKALNDFSVVNMSGGTTPLTAQAFVRSMMFRLTGATSAATLLIPARTDLGFLRRIFAVTNSTAFVMTVQIGATVGISIPAGNSAILYHDGTNITALTAGAAAAAVAVTQTTSLFALAGQTAFTLLTMTAPGSVLMVVNGVKYTATTDYVASGTTVNWVGPFVFSPADFVTFTYA